MRKIASRHVLYAFNFGGTLARISRDRDGVKLSCSTHEWVRELATRVPCAIVSGRALGDLGPRVNGAVPYLIGNHGVESPLTPAPALSVAEQVCIEWMRQVDTGLTPLLNTAGIEVEDKRYTLTFHHCRTSESAEIHETLVLLLNRLIPVPELICGKSSVNALPLGVGEKGRRHLLS
ncbi:MAG: hypothetical protein HP496_15685 [Nitrospira sp.]|nr:hypothetical protein [Nitrospira sp.]